MLHRNIARAPSGCRRKGQAARLLLARGQWLCSSAAHRAKAQEWMGVQMLEWMLMPIRRYADFSGRSRRKEFWFFQLLNFIVSVVLFGPLYYAMIRAMIVMGDTVDPGTYEASAAGALQWGDHPIAVGLAALGALWALFVFIPGIAVTVRRLHDRDMSGWWYLGLIVASIIPFVGLIAGLAFLVLMFLEGTKGPNRFGDDPKGGASADVFA